MLRPHFYICRSGFLCILLEGMTLLLIAGHPSSKHFTNCIRGRDRKPGLLFHTSWSRRWSACGVGLNQNTILIPRNRR